MACTIIGTYVLGAIKCYDPATRSVASFPGSNGCKGARVEGETTMTVRLDELRNAWPEAADIIARLPEWCQDKLVVVADVREEYPYFAVLINDVPELPADPAIHGPLSELRQLLIQELPGEVAQLMVWARQTDSPFYRATHTGYADYAPIYHEPEGEWVDVEAVEVGSTPALGSGE